MEDMGTDEEEELLEVCVLVTVCHMIVIKNVYLTDDFEVILRYFFLIC